MKKNLLLALIISFSASTFAQFATIKQQAKFNSTIDTKTLPVKDPQPVYQGEVNPFVTNERDQDIVIGNTWYDLQSNSSIDHRIISYGDGTMAAVWTRGITASSYPDRGTGYNYYDGSSWGPAPTDRIEPERVGWPTIAKYGENGEIICTHTASSGLLYSWRENKGTGEWNFFYQLGPDGVPGGNGLTWPRMITTGENNDVIHVISALYDYDYEDVTSPVLYSRSSDGGETWDPENVILEGMGSDYTAMWGGDNYAWAEPNAGVLAFVVFEGIGDGIIMKSVDGGDSWERITFYESPDPFFDGNAGDLPQCGGGDGFNAIAIDDDGMVHVAFGRQIHLDDTPDDDAWSYYPFSDGLVYWNETMPALDTAQIGATILPTDAEWEDIPIYQNGQLAAWTQPNGNDTLIDVATYYASLTSMPQLVIQEDGNIKVFYSAVSVGFDNETYNFRHIWGRSTEGDGNWSEFTDYTSDVFHIFSECVFPSAAPSNLNGMHHLLYMTDNLPGNSTQPSDAPTHDPVNNNIVYLPADLHVGIEDQYETTNFEVSQNMPNPATSETAIVVNTEVMGPVSLTLSNLLGQQVYQVTENANNLGNHTFKLNVSDLDSGIYFYTVQIGEKAITKKMLVQ